ncbi:short-chain dehydrogenase/reductase SDR [Hyaloraphidium curvatum]|nr:short-chain dehydrogenase/reductase SDR [Hyaloraphidium curvatum]
MASFTPHPAGTGPRMLNPSTSQGRVVFVTGGASPKGFGHTAAVLMARHGARVVVTDLAAFEANGKKVVAEIEAEGGKAAWCPLDVTDEAQWEEAIAFAERTFGPLDVLLNNAGVGAEYSEYMRPHEDGAASIAKHPTADWRRLCSINQDGVYFGIKHGAGSMERNPVPEGKSIVNISSGAGFIGGTGIGYTATKWAVRGMTKHAALFLAHKNIRCNSVHPGAFPTNILDGIFDNPALPADTVEEIRYRWNNAHPMGRMGEPIEVANLILYLASTESSFTTGSEHIIDGALLTTAGFSSNPFPKGSLPQAKANGH